MCISISEPTDVIVKKYNKIQGNQMTNDKNKWQMTNWNDSLTLSLSLKRFTNLPLWTCLSCLISSTQHAWVLSKPTTSNNILLQHTQLLLKVYSPSHYSSHRMVFTCSKKEISFLLKTMQLICKKIIIKIMQLYNGI